MKRAALPVALLAAAAGLAAGQTPAPPVFGARVETIYVDAFVTQRGRPARGLLAADFEVKDNGVIQAVELASADSLPLLAVLAFDTSASVAGEKLAELQRAATAFLDGLKPRDEAAVLAFCEEIRWLSAPTGDRARLSQAIQGLRPRGGTAVLDGLYAALTLPVAETRTLVVLFSDGQDNLSWLGERQVRVVAERSNALIHVVALRPPEAEPGFQTRGIGPSPPPEPEHLRALRQIAEVTGGRLWTAESPDRLRNAFAAVAEAMGHRYILRYEPRNVPRPGWHRLEVRLRGKGEVRARRGYWVGR